MGLTGKQRRYLRSLGTGLRPTVFVGRGGITERVITALDAAFNTQDLVKVKLQERFAGDRHRAAEELSNRSGAELVQVLGKTILLYRRHPEKPKIELP